MPCTATTQRENAVVCRSGRRALLRLAIRPEQPDCLHEKAAREWLQIMETKLTHESTGLFQTEALGVKRYSRQPRGCSSAYMIYYMSHFAPEHAALQWGKFKAAMLARSFGMTGFREYLPDFAGNWTPDSGPIVAGIGVAASALAIKAAGAMGDSEVQSGLITSAGRAYRVLNTIGHIPGVNRLTRLARSPRQQHLPIGEHHTHATQPDRNRGITT